MPFAELGPDNFPVFLCSFVLYCMVHQNSVFSSKQRNSPRFLNLFSGGLCLYEHLVESLFSMHAGVSQRRFTYTEMGACFGGRGIAYLCLPSCFYVCLHSPVVWFLSPSTTSARAKTAEVGSFKLKVQELLEATARMQQRQMLTWVSFCTLLLLWRRECSLFNMQVEQLANWLFIVYRSI